MSASIHSLLAQHAGRVRMLEAHDRDSFRTITTAVGSDGQRFQGIWISGLTQTTCLGVPDTEIISPLKRASLLSWLRDCIQDDISSQPYIAFDGDSGGPANEIESTAATLIQHGVSMIIIEDKSIEAPGDKVNSLDVASASQPQADMHEFAETIKAYVAAASQHSQKGQLTVTARIESFIVRIPEKDAEAEKRSVQAALQDALARADVYREAGVHAITIHSKSAEPDEVLAFLRNYRARDPVTPIIVVPTTYSRVAEDILYQAGANVVIYANHLIRAKIHAVKQMYGEIPPLQSSKPFHDSALTACAAAQNYGCLLSKLGARSNLEHHEAAFFHEANARAISTMVIVAHRLLSGRRTGAADTHLISVKDLLQINSQQVSRVEVL